MNEAVNTPLLVVLLAIVVPLAAAAWILVTTRRTKRLRSRFGPEYTRAVEQQGGARRAERVLEMRQKRIEELHIRALAEADRRRFLEAWQADQAQFIDDPPSAVVVADRLVTDVMAARGYPIADFAQRATDISVSHPLVVEKYRRASEIALQHQRGMASTEDLRRAMVYYRDLFEELLGATVPVRKNLSSG